MSGGGRPIQHCRFCCGALSIPFCDLGAMPLANAYVDPRDAAIPDATFPLEVRVCERCWLAQLAFIADAHAIFGDYAYFSSMSDGWLGHAARFAALATARLGLRRDDLVVEVGSNDGYLLRNFVAGGVRCLGIDPAANIASVAEAAGVPTWVRFFGRSVADEVVAAHGHARLVVANNVLAHVPDLNDFVAGLAQLVGRDGVVAIEAPHLARLVDEVQFDTIYHEHYAYWSLSAMERVLGAHGLVVYDVERLETHGGSLRVWATAGTPGRETRHGLAEVRAEEAALGMCTPVYYTGFEPRVRAVLDDSRRFLDRARREGRRVAGYGAAAKGNTFLNALGATMDDLLFVADRSPAKQGKLLPGSRIAIHPPESIAVHRPDHVLILPWNIATEVWTQHRGIAAWGGRFVVAIPHLQEFDAS
jgi:2-polyprenyl-3-methyl-5-hydroxy-6-metoxy-1,4-benzoquinol methylase